jgi:toxin ParE1/3/4
MLSLQSMEVKWTRTALASLAAIVAYIEEDSPERARSFALEIRAKTNSLVEFPAMGRPGRVIGTRELVIHPQLHHPVPRQRGIR